MPNFTKIKTNVLVTVTKSKTEGRAEKGTAESLIHIRRYSFASEMMTKMRHTFYIQQSLFVKSDFSRQNEANQTTS